MPLIHHASRNSMASADFAAEAPPPGERGYHRRKLASLAGTVYRAGATAVSGVRDSYVQHQRAREVAAAAAAADPNSGVASIPGSFPEVDIAVQGDAQMVLFPSYAKVHTPRHMARPEIVHASGVPHGSLRDEDYWREEWQHNEDNNAVVDVDVRGWIYSPHKGPLNRRNRILLGIARHLSGVPGPRNPNPVSSNGAFLANASASASTMSLPTVAQSSREEEKIVEEAAEIERRGRMEKVVALEGGYSEVPGTYSDPDSESIYNDWPPSQSPSRDLQGLDNSSILDSAPSSAPGSPDLGPSRLNSTLSALPSPAGPFPLSGMSDAELAAANSNLSARIAPFLATGLPNLPVSLFFYNENESRSRTVMTSEGGHFTIRAALDFVPTHVRVLAHEDLSVLQEVRIIQPYGVSLISDIDDTIKHSNISAGAREIFRNAFVRDLADLRVDGMREWYGALHAAGVAMHYCSNSPWQLYPVLASFFTSAGLPLSSLHLKQYSGMLQGIFEPVAERKRSTLNRLMLDFPHRRFLLVGDSGEADLEVYTELALSNPGRILAIFIRDLTSPPDMAQPTRSARANQQSGQATRTTAGEEPLMGTLIDLSEEPSNMLLGRKPTHPLSWIQNSSEQVASANSDSAPSLGNKPAPPLPRRRGTPSNIGSLSPRLLARRTQTANSDIDFDPLPPPIAASATAGPGRSPDRPTSRYMGSASSPAMGPQAAPTIGPPNRKLELWRRRLAHARDALGPHGVALYTWRHPDEVAQEALRMANSVLMEGQDLM